MEREMLELDFAGGNFQDAIEISDDESDYVPAGSLGRDVKPIITSDTQSQEEENEDESGDHAEETRPSGSRTRSRGRISAKKDKKAQFKYRQTTFTKIAEGKVSEQKLYKVAIASAKAKLDRMRYKGQHPLISYGNGLPKAQRDVVLRKTYSSAQGYLTKFEKPGMSWGIAAMINPVEEGGRCYKCKDAKSDCIFQVEYDQHTKSDRITSRCIRCIHTSSSECDLVLNKNGSVKTPSGSSSSRTEKTDSVKARRKRKRSRSTSSLTDADQQRRSSPPTRPRRHGQLEAEPIIEIQPIRRHEAAVASSSRLVAPPQGPGTEIDAEQSALDCFSTFPSVLRQYLVNRGDMDEQSVFMYEELKVHVALLQKIKKDEGKLSVTNSQVETSFNYVRDFTKEIRGDNELVSKLNFKLRAGLNQMERHIGLL